MFFFWSIFKVFYQWLDRSILNVKQIECQVLGYMDIQCSEGPLDWQFGKENSVVFSSIGFYVSTWDRTWGPSCRYHRSYRFERRLAPSNAQVDLRQSQLVSVTRGSIFMHSKIFQAYDCLHENYLAVLPKFNHIWAHHEICFPRLWAHRFAIFNHIMASICTIWICIP